MATFITTLHFTEQGIKAVRDSCERAAGFKATAKKMGVKVTGQYWTLGAFDGVIVCEAPDEENGQGNEADFHAVLRSGFALGLGLLLGLLTPGERAGDTARAIVSRTAAGVRRPMI